MVCRQDLAGAVPWAVVFRRGRRDAVLQSFEMSSLIHSAPHSPERFEGDDHRVQSSVPINGKVSFPTAGAVNKPFQVGAVDIVTLLRLRLARLA